LPFFPFYGKISLENQKYTMLKIKRIKNLLVSVPTILSLLFSNIAFAASDSVNMSIQVIPADATHFVAIPGSGECTITWTSSTTPNITNQAVYIDDGTTIISYPVPFPGPGITNTVLPETPLVVSGLIPGWTYILRHVSETSLTESSGVWTICTPTSPLLAPIMNSEQPPNSIVGTTNEVSWILQGGIDPTTHLCNVQASTTDLNVDPNTFNFETGWQSCDTFETTPGNFAYTFTGLSYATYFYHVQVGVPPAVPAVKSPFSNVVFQTQVASSGGGGGGGGTITPVCGNNIKQYGEQCDDGNITPGDGCSATCQNEPAPVCGNSAIETGETCDDGNAISGDGCSSTCATEAVPVVPVCGNSVTEEGETCDDGNTVSDDGCSSTCDTEHAAAQECGNNAVETGEECDDGNVLNDDGCNAVCMLEPSEECGNGTLEDPEQCDDGNILNGDGCSETCALEVVEVRFEIKGAPEFRVLHATDPNLSLNSQFLVYKPSISNLDNVRIKLDEFGNATYEGLIVTGNYDFGLNGEAHNTKLIRGIEITPETEVVTLDFTYAETVKLTAGDTVDDNYINGVDMSKIIQQYRLEGAEVLSDLNREGYVNGIDASIVITNYRKTGEAF